MIITFVRLAFEPIEKVGQIELPETMDTVLALNTAYAKFNRGSGEEIEFSGPSASVEDLFIVVRNNDYRFKEVYQIASFGFKEIKRPRFADES